METTEELSTFLTAATVDGILGRLLYRGAAWSLMRKNGVLPQNAPPLGATVTNGAIVIHTQRLKSDPGGNLLS
ncbi:hypothetical protein OSL73_22680 [Escherichia coli]|nr:hypothetical protein [Escherichia coli]